MTNFHNEHFETLMQNSPSLKEVERDIETFLKDLPANRKHRTLADTQRLGALCQYYSLLISTLDLKRVRKSDHGTQWEHSEDCPERDEHIAKLNAFLKIINDPKISSACANSSVAGFIDSKPGISTRIFGFAARWLSTHFSTSAEADKNETPEDQNNLELLIMLRDMLGQFELGEMEAETYAQKFPSSMLAFALNLQGLLENAKTEQALKLLEEKLEKDKANITPEILQNMRELHEMLCEYLYGPGEDGLDPTHFEDDPNSLR